MQRYCFFLKAQNLIDFFFKKKEEKRRTDIRDTDHEQKTLVE